jgi:hypothetical protein
VDVSQFPSNSRDPRVPNPEEPKKTPVLKVVKGEVSVQKKSMTTRLLDFVRKDSKVIIDNVIHDVVIPNIKSMVSDSVREFTDRTLFGGERGATRRFTNRVSGFSNVANKITTNYQQFATPNPDRVGLSDRARANHEFDEIIIADRGDAEDVLYELQQRVHKYGIVTVGDMYRMLDLAANHADEKFGWTDLSTARIRTVGPSAYKLDLPKPEVI